MVIFLCTGTRGHEVFTGFALNRVRPFEFAPILYHIHDPHRGEGYLQYTWQGGVVLRRNILQTQKYVTDLLIQKNTESVNFQPKKTCWTYPSCILRVAPPPPSWGTPLYGYMLPCGWLGLLLCGLCLIPQFSSTSLPIYGLWSSAFPSFLIVLFNDMQLLKFKTT